MRVSYQTEFFKTTFWFRFFALSQFSVDTSWYLNAQSVCLCFSERDEMQLHITHTWSIISRTDFKGSEVFTSFFTISQKSWFSWRGKLMQTRHFFVSLSHCAQNPFFVQKVILTKLELEQIEKSENCSFGYEIMILETKVLSVFVKTWCPESILFCKQIDFVK